MGRNKKKIDRICIESGVVDPDEMRLGIPEVVALGDSDKPRVQYIYVSGPRFATISIPGQHSSSQRSGATNNTFFYKLFIPFQKP